METQLLVRHSKKKTEVHTVMLFPEQWALILQLAEEHHIKKSDAARYLLGLGIQVHTAQTIQGEPV